MRFLARPVEIWAVQQCAAFATNLAELQKNGVARTCSPPPSTDSTPAETTDAGSGLGNGGDRPITCQALPSGSATKRVPSFDFTRNNSVCLPSLRASEICLRTSAGLETDLPLTSRMTSPTWKP